MSPIYSIMTAIFLLAMSIAVSGSRVPEKEGASKQLEEVAPLAYTVPNSTWNYSTIEEILAEIAANKAEQTDETGQNADPGRKIQKRALGCASTGVAYGSNTGAAFTDFTTTNPWPCGVDVVEIRIRAGSLIDAIQMRYKTVDNTYIQGARRGGGGGAEHVINLQPGERITGVSGVICTRTDAVGVYVSQLAFFSERINGQKLIYGPYAGASAHVCRMFAVNGKINSIFGRVRDDVGSITALTAIGFYYEDESTSTQHAYGIIG